MDQKTNSYVQGYLTEHSTIDSYTQSILTEQYNADINVAAILQKYSKSKNILQKAIAFNEKDRIDVMHIIIDIYPEVTNESEKAELLYYLSNYAEWYNDKQSVSFLQNQYEIQKSQSVSPLTISGYNGYTASTYAQTWANSFNTNYYPAFDLWQSDCVNFVSQALHAGGIPFQDNWYCYKKNSTYLYPVNGTQLDYSWTLANPSPFTSIAQFTWYWNDIRGVPVDPYSKSDYLSKHASAFYSDVAIGDVIIFTKVYALIQIGVHAAMVTGYDGANLDFLYSAHTVGRRNAPLLTGIQGLD